METIEDAEDEPVNRNFAPHNKNRVLESANGSAAATTMTFLQV